MASHIKTYPCLISISCIPSDSKRNCHHDYVDQLGYPDADIMEQSTTIIIMMFDIFLIYKL